MMFVLWRKSGKKELRNLDDDYTEFHKANYLYNVQYPIGDPFTDHVYRVTIVDNFYKDSHKIVWDTDIVLGIDKSRWAK